MVLIRGSAAYQGITDWRGTSTALGSAVGIYNYFTNTGDNPGDPLEVGRGIKYTDEVPLNSQSLSCISEEAVAQEPDGGGGGGDGGLPGPSAGDSVGGGYLLPGNSWEICFYQDSYPPYCWIDS